MLGSRTRATSWRHYFAGRTAGGVAAGAAAAVFTAVFMFVHCLFVRRMNMNILTNIPIDTRRVQP